jgi:DNA-binding MarR family transcriptional regulator
MTRNPELADHVCTCFRLRRTARRVTQIYDRRLAPLGLRVTQYSLLAHLVGKPPTAIGAFAEVMGMDRTTLTRNVRPLLAAGYLELAQGGDRRTRALALTAEGKALFRRAWPLWRAAELEVRATLGAGVTAELHRTLAATHEKLNALATAA